MRIAVMSEFSTAFRNAQVVEALQSTGHEIVNVGMTDADFKPFTTYVDLGLMAASLLNSGAVDFVVTGCGTGEGATISLNHYPNVFCGKILDPVDAYIFSQLNCGNAIALALNKGFGAGGDINMKYIFQRLFENEWEGGFPPTRAEFQGELRANLKSNASFTTRPLIDALREMPESSYAALVGNELFMDCLKKFAPDHEITRFFVEKAAKYGFCRSDPESEKKRRCVHQRIGAFVMSVF